MPPVCSVEAPLPLVGLASFHGPLDHCLCLQARLESPERRPSKACEQKTGGLLHSPVTAIKAPAGPHIASEKFI